MEKADRKLQIKSRITVLVVGALCLAAGLLTGLYIGINYGDSWEQVESTPGAYGSICEEFSIPDGEITELIYENYWNFIPMSYIIVGNDRETCKLYKISDKVLRHDYNLENFVTDSNGYMTYSDEKYSSKLGVDVSKFQGDIDWAVVAEESDVSWTMLRLGYRGYSEGKLALDSTFTANAAGAMENNIDIGIYFFTQAVNYEEGVEEAEFVLSNIADIDVKYPIVIDTEEMEADNARANGISNSDRTDAIVGFCETIKAAGYTPMIYANRNWYAESLDMDRLGDYGLWLAQYSNVPDFPYMFSAWQYTPYGSVPGITGDVDLDIWIE